MSTRYYKGSPIITGEMIAEAHRKARKERALAFRQIAIAVASPVVRAIRAIAGASRDVDLPGSAASDGLGKTTSGRGFM